MVDKTSIGSGLPLPPSTIPLSEAAATPASKSPGVAPLSEYFWEVAKAGAEYLAQTAQTLSEAQAPKELKPEEAAAYFDRAEMEFHRAYKEGGTEDQARVQIDAMQAAVPGLMAQAQDPEVQAYLKAFTEVTPEEAAKSYDEMGTIDSASLKQGIGKAPADPAKAKVAFEILSRFKALEAAKSDYFDKYHPGSQKEPSRQAFYKQKKAETMLREMGRQIRETPFSLDAQRLLIALDENIGDYASLGKDLDAWTLSARQLKDPTAKTEELAAILQHWAGHYVSIPDLSGPEIQAKIQSVKDEIVANLRENPHVLSYQGQAILGGSERARNFLDQAFPPSPSPIIVRPDLLSKVNLVGMTVFAQVQFEAEESAMAAVKKFAAGDIAGAKEDYLMALGNFAELHDEAATQAMDGKIRDILGAGASSAETLRTFGRMYAEVKGSGVKLESQLKEEISSSALLGSFLEPSIKLTQGGGGTSSELLKVSEDLVQLLKVRQEAGISNDDPLMLTELDRLQLAMDKAAVAEGTPDQDKLKLREQSVRVDVARLPEYAQALANPIREGGYSVAIVASYRGPEMVRHLEAWQTAIFQSHLEPKEELGKWAEMSGVLSLYQPLTKLGDAPPITQANIDALALPISQSVEALAPKVLSKNFPDLSSQPELLAQLGGDLSTLSSQAMTHGDAAFVAVLRDPKALGAFVKMTLEARKFEAQAQVIEGDLKLLRDTAPNFSDKKAKALQLHMQAAELYANRGGPAERVRGALRPAMDFYEGIAADPDLSQADRAEAYLDMAKLYQGLGLKEDALALYDKILGQEREQKLSGKENARLSSAATMARGEKALMKDPPDYDAAKGFFHSLQGVEAAQQRYEAIVSYQRAQRLPKVIAALEAVADDYAQKLGEKKGVAEAEKFRGEFQSRIGQFQENLRTGNYRSVEELFQDWGYVHYDPLQGYEDLKWVTGETDSMDWKEFNRKSLGLLKAATNPESGDKEFAELGLDMGKYLGSAGDLDFWDFQATDVAYFSASSQILGMMEQDQFVGASAKSYRSEISNRVVKNIIGKELGNLSIIGAENLGEATKSAALWLIPAGVGRLAGTGFRLLGAGEKVSVLANVVASTFGGMLVDSAWTGNWEAFSAKGLQTSGVSGFVSYFGYRYIGRVGHGIEEAGKLSAAAGTRIAGQAALKPAYKVLLKMGEFTAGGLFEAGTGYAKESLGLQGMNPEEAKASPWLRGFRHFIVGGFTNLQQNAGERVAGEVIDVASGGRVSAFEQKIHVQDRLVELQSAAKSLGWDFSIDSAQAWIQERRPPNAGKPGEQELAALLAMDPKRLEAIGKNPATVADAKEVVSHLYPDLDPASWESQTRAFAVLDYFDPRAGKSIREQFTDFQKTAASLEITSPESMGAFYEFAYQGIPPTRLRKYSGELAADPQCQNKLDALVDAYYVKPGFQISETSRAGLRAEVTLDLFRQSLETGKSPKKLLTAQAAEASPGAKASPTEPEISPKALQASYAGFPLNLEDIGSGFAKLLGFETKKAAKEKGWKALNDWVEDQAQRPLTLEDSNVSKGTAEAVAKRAKEFAAPLEDFLDQAGIQHPGLREKFQTGTAKFGLSSEVMANWTAKGPELGRQLKEITEGLLGKESFETAQGQLLASELLFRTV
ncbi:MAG: hypothetical protein K8R69_03980, partial [Deltaproteobacteria bacterium]|nr:hypothetical protein [Deltaproteobacteria bacterium]